MHETSKKTVAIIGSGTMGAQIGVQWAVNGYPVCFIDLSRDTLDRARVTLERSLDERQKGGSISSDAREAILARVRFVADMQEGVADADLVIECAPEKLELKRSIFAQLDAHCPSGTILATNSSSLRASALEDATGRPDKVINLHYYQPVAQRRIVEIMKGTQTSDETVETVRQMALGADLIPLLVLRESTGFIFNRVWRAIKKECLHLVDQGVATHEDVDRAWMVIMGHPVGPFALMDMVGLDVVRDIEQVYYEESGDPADAPPKLLLDLVEQRRLGMKSGEGFYRYPDPAFKKEGWLRGEHER